jgi:hypothetical protein
VSDLLGGWTLLGAFGQEEAQNPPEGVGDPLGASGKPAHVLAEQLPRVADEGCDAAAALVEHDAQRVQVGGRPGDLAEEDLRRHVERRSQDPGEVVGADGVVDPGYSEVHDSGSRGVGARIEEDVGGFDVAVNDARSVDGHQTPRHVRSDAGDFRRGQRTVGRQLPTQISARHVVHDDGEGRSLDDEVADVHDVGRANPRQRRPFLDEAPDEAFVLDEVRPEDLEGQHVLLGPLRAEAVLLMVRDGSPTPHLPLGSTPDALIEHIVATEATHAFSDGGRTGTFQIYLVERSRCTAACT